MGHAGQPEHGQRAEPEDLRADRGVAEPADRRANTPTCILDGIWLKRSWGGEVRNVAVLVAIGVGSDGYREVLGVCEGTKEDKESWRSFLRHLKQRGLAGRAAVHLATSAWGWSRRWASSIPEAALAALRGALVPQRAFGGAQGQGRRRWRRCSRRSTPRRTAQAARKKAADVVDEAGGDEAGQGGRHRARRRARRRSATWRFPPEHWRQLRTNNPLERIMREIRRRTRVVGAFPDGTVGVDAGGGPVASRGRHALGHPQVPGHGSIVGTGARGSGRGHHVGCVDFAALPLGGEGESDYQSPRTTQKPKCAP